MSLVLNNPAQNVLDIGIPDTDVRLPDIWSISGTAEDYNEYEIPATDPLFNKIKKKFRDAGCKPMAVNKVTNLQYPHSF